MRRERKQARWKPGTIIKWQNVTGAITGALLHVARFCTCSLRHMRRTAGYKDERKMWLGGKTRNAIRRRASRWPFRWARLPGEGVRKGNREKERQRKSETPERGDCRKGSPHGLQAAVKRKVTPKRLHAAVYCFVGFLRLNITGSFVGLTNYLKNYFL